MKASHSLVARVITHWVGFESSEFGIWGELDCDFECNETQRPPCEFVRFGEGNSTDNPRNRSATKREKEGTGWGTGSSLIFGEV